MVPELLNNPNTGVRLIIRMLSVGYLPVDCFSPVDSGAPTRGTMLYLDICTGKALSAPVYEDLKTYPVKVEGGHPFVQVV